jgi:hypothetical protein
MVVNQLFSDPVILVLIFEVWLSLTILTKEPLKVGWPSDLKLGNLFLVIKLIPY